MGADWLIDAGHTRIKWARLDESGKLADPGSCRIEEFAALEHILAGAPRGRIIASLQTREDPARRIAELARRHGHRLHDLAAGSPAMPVEPAYSGLGSDRWLALQAAWTTSREAVCVIDCGTAMTVDVVDDGGIHLGGWIMAGLDTARQALLARADRLPRDEAKAIPPETPATTTPGAIEAGSRLQMAGAIERVAAAAADRLGKNPVVWLTGGDAAAIMPLIRIDARMDENLVMHGLAMAAKEC